MIFGKKNSTLPKHSIIDPRAPRSKTTASIGTTLLSVNMKPKRVLSRASIRKPTKPRKRNHSRSSN